MIIFFDILAQIKAVSDFYGRKAGCYFYFLSLCHNLIIFLIITVNFLFIGSLLLQKKSNYLKVNNQQQAGAFLKDSLSIRCLLLSFYSRETILFSKIISGHYGDIFRRRINIFNK